MAALRKPTCGRGPSAGRAHPTTSRHARASRSAGPLPAVICKRSQACLLPSLQGRKYAPSGDVQNTFKAMQDMSSLAWEAGARHGLPCSRGRKSLPAHTLARPHLRQSLRPPAPAGAAPRNAHAPTPRMLSQANPGPDQNSMVGGQSAKFGQNSHRILKVGPSCVGPPRFAPPVGRRCQSILGLRSFPALFGDFRSVRSVQAHLRHGKLAPGTGFLFSRGRKSLPITHLRAHRGRQQSQEVPAHTSAPRAPRPLARVQPAQKGSVGLLWYSRAPCRRTLHRSPCQISRC